MLEFLFKYKYKEKTEYKKIKSSNFIKAVLKFKRDYLFDKILCAEELETGT
jgi:hypothetical protein